MASSRATAESGTSEPPAKRARVDADGERDSTPNDGGVGRVADDQKMDADFSDEEEEEDTTRRRRKAVAAGASQPSDMYLDTVMYPYLLTTTIVSYAF